MDSTVRTNEGWNSYQTYFTKLGDYFDRANWWDEGSKVINDFFGEDSTQTDLHDPELEQLLDVFESHAVGAETRKPDDTAADYLPQEKQDLQPKHDLIQPIDNSDENEIKSQVNRPLDEPSIEKSDEETGYSLFGSHTSSPDPVSPSHIHASQPVDQIEGKRPPLNYHAQDFSNRHRPCQQSTLF